MKTKHHYSVFFLVHPLLSILYHMFPWLCLDMDIEKYLDRSGHKNYHPAQGIEHRSGKLNNCTISSLVKELFDVKKNIRVLYGLSNICYAAFIQIII